MKYIILLTALVFCNCARVGYTGQMTDTQVRLEKKNFIVVGNTYGSASAYYFLGMTFNEQGLITKARANLYVDAKIKGKSRAIVNLVTEFIYSGLWPLFYKVECVVSGEAIEFIDEGAIVRLK